MLLPIPTSDWITGRPDSVFPLERGLEKAECAGVRLSRRLPPRPRTRGGRSPEHELLAPPSTFSPWPGGPGQLVSRPPCPRRGTDHPRSMGMIDRWMPALRRCRDGIGRRAGGHQGGSEDRRSPTTRTQPEPVAVRAARHGGGSPAFVPNVGTARDRPAVRRNGWPPLPLTPSARPRPFQITEMCLAQPWRASRVRFPSSPTINSVVSGRPQGSG